MIRVRNVSFVLMLFGLAACGGGGGGSGDTTALPVGVTPAMETQIGGANFGTAYRVSPNTEASDPAAGDVPAVDPTKNPTDI